jgi:ribosomal protein S6 kinase alpha-5
VPSTTTTTTTSPSSTTYGYDESCDLWSLGVILYTMLSGEVPFNSITTHRTAEDIVEDITRSKLSYDTPAWKNVSQAAKDLVKGLLTVDPSKRLTIKDLSRNPWLRGSSIPTTHDHLMTPSILCQASRSLIVCHSLK